MNEWQEIEIRCTAPHQRRSGADVRDGACTTLRVCRHEHGGHEVELAEGGPLLSDLGYYQVRRPGLVMRLLPGKCPACGVDTVEMREVPDTSKAWAELFALAGAAPGREPRIAAQFGVRRVKRVLRALGHDDLWTIPAAVLEELRPAILTALAEKET